MLDGIKEWLAKHHTVRKVIKGTAFAFLGLLVASQVEIVDWLEMEMMATLPEWMPMWLLLKPGIIGAFVGLGNWVKYNTSLPGAATTNTKKK